MLQETARLQSLHHARVWQWFESVWDGPAEPTAAAGAKTHRRQDHINAQRRRLHKILGGLLPQLQQAHRMWNAVCTTAEVSQALLDELAIVSADLEAMLASVFMVRDGAGPVEHAPCAVPIVPGDQAVLDVAQNRTVRKPFPTATRKQTAQTAGLDVGLLSQQLETECLALEEVFLNQGELITQGQRDLLAGKDNVVVIE